MLGGGVVANSAVSFPTPIGRRGVLNLSACPRRVNILSNPIKKLPPNSEGKVRYQFVVDAGIDPETGKRKQLRRTFDSLKEGP